MQKISTLRYRTALILGIGYVAVFVGVYVIRFWWPSELRMGLPDAASLVFQLVFLWLVGSLCFLPLIWTLRRFRRSHWIPIIAYAIAFPVSLFGAIFGGLLGSPGVILYAGAPFALAIGLSFGIQAILGPQELAEIKT